MSTLTVAASYQNGISTVEIPVGFDPDNIFLLMNGQVWAGDNLTIEGGAVSVAGVDLTDEIIQISEGVAGQSVDSSAASDEKLDLILSVLTEGGAETITINNSGVQNSIVSAVSGLSINPSLGMSKTTGRTITGLEHLHQSIKDIFMTRKGTRVMRANYGSDLMELLDKPVNESWVANVIIAVSECLERWEPRFNLSAVEVSAGAVDGRFNVALEGGYIPK